MHLAEGGESCGWSMARVGYEAFQKVRLLGIMSDTVPTENSAFQLNRIQGKTWFGVPLVS